MSDDKGLPHLGQALSEGLDISLGETDQERDEAPGPLSPILRPPGDPRAAGPMPLAGAILARTALGATVGVAVAVAAFVLSSSGMRQGLAAVELGSRIELWGRAVAVGLHPSVLIYWFVLLFGVTFAAIGAERLTRRSWAATILIIVGFIPLWASFDPIPYLLEIGFPGRPNDRFHLAAPNLSARWSLVIAVVTVGYHAGRRDDGLVSAAVVVMALFVAWELDRARVAEWTRVVTDFFGTIGRGIRDDQVAAELARSRIRAARWMHARALSDFVLLCSPWLATTAATRRTRRRLVRA